MRIKRKLGSSSAVQRVNNALHHIKTKTKKLSVCYPLACSSEEFNFLSVGRVKEEEGV